MKKTTVHLPEELATALRLRASQRGMTVSALVRQILSEGLPSIQPPDRSLLPTVHSAELAAAVARESDSP